MGIATALVSRWWGRVADRTTNRRALLFALAGLAPMIALYLVARQPWALLLLSAGVGVFVAGFNLLVFNTFLETTPVARRSGYVAVFNTLMWCSGLAPMLGVALYDRFGLDVAFLGAAALRLAGWAWLRQRMTES